MKSIESHLLKRLLIGQGILWLVASIAVWRSEHSRLYSDFDRKLQFASPGLQFHLRGSEIDSELEKRWPGFLNSENKGYLQVWKKDGTTKVKTANLGEADLVLPFDPDTIDEVITSGPPVIQLRMINFEGPRGERLRGSVAALRSGPPHMPHRRPPPKHVRSQSYDFMLVAKSRETLDRKLLLLGVGVIVTGAIASAFTAMLVKSSVKIGLLPLFQMGREASSIDIQNLETRFNSESIPRELQPISIAFNDLLNRIEAGVHRERSFNSDAAHELRSPIAEIKSLAELMVKWPEESNPDRHFEILKTARHIETVLQSLLNLAQWDSNHEPLEIENIEIGAVVEEFRDRLNHQITTKELNFSIEGMSREIPADPTLVNLIVSNLVSNAITYAPEKGDVIVSFSENPESILTISNSVIDIKPEDIPQFSARFWRADGVRTGSRHSGLGLSIVSACVDRLGWKITISLESDSNRIRFQISEDIT